MLVRTHAASPARPETARESHHQPPEPVRAAVPGSRPPSGPAGSGEVLLDGAAPALRRARGRRGRGRGLLATQRRSRRPRALRSAGGSKRLAPPSHRGPDAVMEAASPVRTPTGIVGHGAPRARPAGAPSGPRRRHWWFAWPACRTRETSAPSSAPADAAGATGAIVTPGIGGPVRLEGPPRIDGQRVASAARWPGGTVVAATAGSAATRAVSSPRPRRRRRDLYDVDLRGPGAGPGRRRRRRPARRGRGRRPTCGSASRCASRSSRSTSRSRQA